MIGACIIDGTDIADLGMFILKGGDGDFIAYPDRKEPLKNDWFEHDGVEIDFSSLTFNPKKIKVDYYLSAPNTLLFKQRLNAFQNLHFASGNRQIFLRQFDYTFSLQFVGVNKMVQKGGLWRDGRKSATLTIEYVDNNPTALFTPSIVTPTGGGILTRVKLNGTDLASYGIKIQDFYSTALNIPNPKLGIATETQFSSGAVVDVGFAPKKQPRKISMECTLLADNLQEFWTNYTALFNQLTQPEPLVFTLSNGTQISCYYTNIASFKKIRPFNSRVYLTFTLNFNEL